jgi:hypothetical protein
MGLVVDVGLAYSNFARTSELLGTLGAIPVLKAHPLSRPPNARELFRSAKEGDGMTAFQRVVADLKVLCAAWGDNP